MDRQSALLGTSANLLFADDGIASAPECTHRLSTWFIHVFIRRLQHNLGLMRLIERTAERPFGKKHQKVLRTEKQRQ